MIDTKNEIFSFKMNALMVGIITTNIVFFKAKINVIFIMII
jgi:hypothetical protein